MPWHSYSRNVLESLDSSMKGHRCPLDFTEYSLCLNSLNLLSCVCVCPHSPWSKYLSILLIVRLRTIALRLQRWEDDCLLWVCEFALAKVRVPYIHSSYHLGQPCNYYDYYGCLAHALSKSRWFDYACILHADYVRECVHVDAIKVGLPELSRSHPILPAPCLPHVATWCRFLFFCCVGGVLVLCLVVWSFFG